MAWPHNINTDGVVSHWDDLRVPANAVRVGPIRDPSFDNFTGGLYTYLFSPSTEEQVYFNVQIPHIWKQGSPINPHIHWGPNATNGTSETVRWGLEYTISEINGIFPVSNTIYAEDTGTFTDKGHYVVGFGSDAIDVSAIDSVSTMLICRLFRDSTHPNDDLVASCWFYEADIHIEIDAPGSIEEFRK